MLADLRAARATLTGSDEHRTQRLHSSTKGARTHSSALISITETLRRPRLSIAFFLVAIIAVGAALWAILHWARTVSPAPFQNIRVTRLTNSGKTVDAAISPDGKYVADVVEEGGKQSLWIRQVDVPVASKQIVAPADGQYEGLTFSPDGKYVYYTVWENNALDVLYQVAVLGDAPRKLLVDLDSSISFSPDGKQFAFIRRHTNRGETALMIASADGAGARMLATRNDPNFFAPFSPAWSPDGKVIACAARSSAGGFHGSVIGVRVADGVESQIGSQTWAIVYRVAWLGEGRGLVIAASDQPSSPFQIWQLSYPGGEARRITNDLNSYIGLSLTEDSSKLVTVQSDRLSNIWIAPDGDASRAAQITSGSSKHYGLSWTPDGKIVYSSIASGNPEIWIMEQDGTGNKQLTTDAHIDRDPSVSPDGRYIVFVSNRTGKFNIWRMNADGSNLKQLTNGDDEQFPHCSPDSQWVVYQGFVNGIPTLWRVAVDGGAPVQLTNKYSNWPVVSPDGNLIACSYLDEASSQWKLAVIPVAGGEPTKSFEIPMPYLQHLVFQRIRWTTDGLGLAYIDERGGISNIWSRALDGGPPRQLTDFKADQVFNFAWSSDGKKLACVRGIVTSDAVLISDLK
jgi:Tol biopolymer transport system component